MRAFDNEWIFEALEEDQSFLTRPMFGGLAAYLFGRMMLVLVEPTKTGRWEWHGVLICTDHERQRAILEEFPQLRPHEVLKKWLYLDSCDEQFAPTMDRLAALIARNDARFGIQPRARRQRGSPRRGQQR